MPSLRVNRRTGPWLVLLVLVAALVASLAVASESVAQSTTPTFSPAFLVRGRIEHPRVYRLRDLQALPAHDVTVSFQGPGGVQTHTYRGALLNDVAKAAAPRFDAKRKNDFLRWTARVHATDNYEVVVAWGEFDPNFEAKKVLLAYAENGQPLVEDGMARLIVPGDIRGGRYVSNVDRVTFEPPFSLKDLVWFLHADDDD